MSKDNKSQENISKEEQAIYDYYAGKPKALEKGFGLLGQFAQMAIDLGVGNGRQGQEAAKIIMMQGLRLSKPVVESVGDSASSDSASSDSASIIGDQSSEDASAE